MASSKRVAIDFTNNFIEVLGNVPRCRIPSELHPVPKTILAWYSQAIAAMRKVCWLVAAKQEASVAAQALYEEARVHGGAIGNPRLPRNRRTWEDLIVDLVDQRNEMIAEQCPPVLAVNEMTYDITWRNEILAALMGATYDSQVDCPDSPFQNPPMFIRHLAEWIGKLKRKRTATLNAYTADSILELGKERAKRAFAPKSISALNMGGAGRGLRGGVPR
jgi:hypothetical protein